MNDKTRNRVWKWSLTGLFGAAALAIAAGGFWLYRHETQSIRSEKQNELKAIAELKADQIAAWRFERAGDARVHSRRAFFRAAVARWLTATGDASLRSAAEESMESVRASYGYENVIVAGRDGSVLFSLNPRLAELEAEAKRLVAQAVRSRDVVFGDLFRGPASNRVHLDVAAPISDAENRPAAVLILRSDPERYLYPLIQSWPTPSRSAETLLIRKDGDEALLLNPLRHRSDPALTLRIPPSRADVPAARAVLGQTGEFEGRDYRDVKVLAEILRVPDSPWCLVTKVDSDEIFAEAQYRGRFIFLFTALSMVVTGAMAALAFSVRQKSLYRNLYCAEQQRRHVEEEIRATFYSIGDGLISTDAAGRVTRMNPVAEHLTGWDEAEALGRPLEQVFHIVNEETRAEVDSPVRRVLREGIVVNLANHTLLIARDGTERPIADSGAPIRSKQGRITGVVLVFRDRTDEHRAEEALRESEEWYRTLFVEAIDGICLADANTGSIIDCNQALAALVGRDKAELIGQPQAILHPPAADHEAFSPTFKQHLGDQVEQVLDAQVVDSRGQIKEVAIRARTLNLAGKRVLQGLFRDITEQKRAEEKLKDARALLHSALNAIQDTFYVFDVTGKFLLWNEAFKRVTGYTDEELASKQPTDFFASQDVPRIAESIERMWKEGSTLQQATVVTKDGTQLPYELNGSILRDGEGSAIGLCGTGRDLTERKRLEEVLRDSETRHRILFESLSDAVMTLAPPSWKFTSCNPATVRMFDVKDEVEFTSLGPWHLSPEMQPDGRPSAEKAKEMIETAMREGSRFFEWTHKRLGGADFPATVLLTRMELAGQAVLQATVRDVTAQKRAEEREARLLERLEGVNQLRENLLLPGSLEGKFTRITEAAVKLLDLDFCRIWSVKPSDLCDHGCIHAAATEGPHACLRRDKCLHLMASSGRYTHTDGNHRRVPMGAYKIGRIATGEERGFLTNSVTTDPRVHNHDWAKSLGLASFAGYKLRDGSGEPIGVLATFAKHALLEEDDAFLLSLAETTSKVIRDSDVQETLRETTKQAVLATQAKSEFLANMSHEIRTPMTSILGYADLLMNDSLGAAQRRAFLTTVRRNGEHLLQLINDILDLSKIEAGKMVMDLGPCHLPSTVADVASMMRPRAEQRGSSLEVRYTGPLPETIRTDGARLRQVIVNLVGNAVKFTENGSIRVGVSFLPQWRSNQPAVSVDVTDTGIGIRQEALPRLFEPFTQAEGSTTRKYGGTGLGLAISRQIVTMLGGELTVESAPGEGSAFTVTIPTGDVSGVSLLPSPGEAICEGEAGARWTPGAGALRGVRILLAEDSIDNQELLRAVLGNVGAEMEVVDNGRLALERAPAGAFDVVLMDMNMPEMDGYEATRRLRDGGYPRPILALTANAMSGDAQRCVAAGCDAHLAKPIDRKQLIETVAQYAMSKGLSGKLSSPANGRGEPDSSTKIRSQFAGDPQLADILPGFVERLSGQLDALCQALKEERLEDAERLAHRLKGAGGSYGYPTLSEEAKSLEAAVKARDRGGAAAALASVQEVCAAIQAGWTDHTVEIGEP